MKPEFIVSTLSKDGQILLSELWDPKDPKGVGHPLQWSLEKTKTGVRMRDLHSNSVKELPDASMPTSQFMILGGKLRIQIHKIRFADSQPKWAPLHTGSVEISTQEQRNLFIRFLKFSLCAFSLVIGLCIALPTPKPTEELIPPQFAKVILTPSKPDASSSKSENEFKSKPVNIVHTFQSASVKKSTQALLKTSIASLLAKSTPFSIARTQSSLGALYNLSRKAQSGPLGDLSKPQVASLEIGASGGKAGKGSVGYGVGEHAGIAGQGSAFIALNNQDSLVDEGLSKDEVGKVIHSHIAEVRYCYESAMIKNPDIQGKLVVNFVIHPAQTLPSAGSVKTAKVNSSTLGDSILDQCILNRLSQWMFPRPRGGVEVAVAYPFIFKSLGK